MELSILDGWYLLVVIWPYSTRYVVRFISLPPVGPTPNSCCPISVVGDGFLLENRLLIVSGSLFSLSCISKHNFVMTSSPAASGFAGEDAMEAVEKTFSEAVLEIPNCRTSMRQLDALVAATTGENYETFLTNLFQEKRLPSPEHITPAIEKLVLKILTDEIKELNKEIHVTSEETTLGVRKECDLRTTDDRKPKKQKGAFPLSVQHLDGNKIADNARIVRAATAGSDESYRERTGSEFIFSGLLAMKSVTDQMKEIALKLLEVGFDAKEGDIFTVEKEEGTIQFHENLAFKKPQNPEKFAELFQRFMPYLLAVDSDIGHLSVCVKFAHWQPGGNWGGVIKVNNDRLFNSATDQSDKTCQTFEKAMLQASKEYLTSSRSHSRRGGRVGNRGGASTRAPHLQGSNRRGGGRRHGIGYQHGRDGGRTPAAGAAHAAGSGGGGH
jgi:hypothetical protein